MQGSSLSEAVFMEVDTNASIEDIDVDCSGLRKDEWLHIPVMLVNTTGQNVANFFCCNVNPMDCVEDKCLGIDNVGVLIMEPLEGMIDMEWVASLRIWPLNRVFHKRCTLAHHLLVSIRRLRVQNTSLERRKKERKKAYVTSRTTLQTRLTKKLQILNNNNIHQLSASLCCDRKCTRYFSREEALALRTEFYTCSPRMRHVKQLEVHGQLHVLPGGSTKVVTLSGRNVFEKTWRYIFAVSKTIETGQNSRTVCVHAIMRT
jgi:hypothetical protein